MRYKIKLFVLIMIFICCMLSTMGFTDISEERELVYFNRFNIQINGNEVDENNITYDGKSFLPLRKTAELLGFNIKWDSESKTIQIVSNKTSNDDDLNLQKDYLDLKNENKVLKEEIAELNNLLIKSPTIDMGNENNESIRVNKNTIYLDKHMNPIIKYKELELSSQDIFGIAFPKSLENLSYQYIEDGIKLNTTFPIYYSNQIKVIGKDDKVMNFEFKTQGLPDLIKNEEAYIVFVPAMPDNGFKFPYMLRIPAKNSEEFHTNNKYLLFDMINNGRGKSLEECFKDVEETLIDKSQSSIRRADKLGYPVIMPIIPRIGVRLESEDFGKGYTYEHALNRMTLLTKELTTLSRYQSFNKYAFERINIDYKKYHDLDEQVISMINHSLNYLNKYGFDLEERIILDGHSASGTFTDRLSMLYPEKIKMSISGATIDDKMLPLKSFKGEMLNYPLGIGDYKEITGKTFDMELHNSVARLIYMGKDDTNNTAIYNDCFTEYGIEQIERLYGIPVLSRAQKIIGIYGQAGAEGILVLDKGVKHGSSEEMKDYVLEFIIANADSDVSVYPDPLDSSLEEKIILSQKSPVEKLEKDSDWDKSMKIDNIYEKKEDKTILNSEKEGLESLKITKTLWRNDPNLNIVFREMYDKDTPRQFLMFIEGLDSNSSHGIEMHEFVNKAGFDFDLVCGDEIIRITQKEFFGISSTGYESAYKVQLREDQDMSIDYNKEYKLIVYNNENSEYKWELEDDVILKPIK